MHRRRVNLLPVLALLSVLAAACVAGTVNANPTAPASSSSSRPAPVTLHLGYQANLTQASALIGVQDGVFARTVGPSVTLTATVFKAGPDEVTALLAGTLDAAYLGPNSAVDAFSRSKGGVRIISGASSGGAYLMTKYAIKTPSDLKGQKIASPAPGSTQDVALRTWLKSQGLNPAPGGNVTIVPAAGPAAQQLFLSGAVAGAWLPEPWASQLQVNVAANAKVFLDEATLWPAGRYATAVLVVRTDYMTRHADVVANLLIGQVASNDLVKGKSAQAQKDTAAAIKSASGVAISQAAADLAWLHITPTNDPTASSITLDASHAQALGLIPSASISGIYDVGLLNSILSSAGEPAVSAA